MYSEKLNLEGAAHKTVCELFLDEFDVDIDLNEDLVIYLHYIEECENCNDVLNSNDIKWKTLKDIVEKFPSDVINCVNNYILLLQMDSSIAKHTKDKLPNYLQKYKKEFFSYLENNELIRANKIEQNKLKTAARECINV